MSVITYGDYSRFNGPAGGKAGNTVKLSNFAKQENVERALLMRGCPWKITAEEIEAFFDGFNASKDEIFIEEFNGKRTGSCLVFFENKDTA